MGAHSSKGSITKKESARSRGNVYASRGTGVQPHELKQQNLQGDLTPSRRSTDSFMQEGRQIKEPVSIPKINMSGYGGNEDDFYDGIPRFPGSLSQKSRSSSFRVRLEKAVDVLDTLGSSVANINSSSGFLMGPASKGNELSILSFEVANTIMKGSSLIQSLSKRSIRLLKEVVFLSEGVQNLVSKDVDELLRTFAADKREELKIFTGEVVRFGNRCKDPQWHNLDLYFEKQIRGLTRPKQLKEDPASVMLQLMTFVQHTAELYQELVILDKLEQDYQQKHQGGANSISIARGYELVSLRQELKDQRKRVKLLKKKSLWCRSMEEVMEKLVDTVIYLYREIQNAFDSSTDDAASCGSPSIRNKLGPAGLALHYANIILQIDSIVARSNSLTSIARGTLYQSLPPDIRSSLKSKLVSSPVEKELSISEIKAEMEKTLCWLAPVAINTAKLHHGFGWVGEWADTGSEISRKPSVLNDINRIETLHHADKERTEDYILELLLWLNHLISQNKVTANVGEVRSFTKTPIPSASNDSNQQPSQVSPPPLATENQDLENKETGLVKHVEEGAEVNAKLPFASTDTTDLPPVDFEFRQDKEKALDAIDGVQKDGVAV